MWRLLRRWRAALALAFLPGDRTPVTREELRELRRDWATWEATFSDILEKLSMQYARQRKREQRQIAQLAEQGPQQPTDPLSGKARKLGLYRKAAARGGQAALALDPPPAPPPPDDGDEP